MSSSIKSFIIHIHTMAGAYERPQTCAALMSNICVCNPGHLLCACVYMCVCVWCVFERERERERERQRDRQTDIQTYRQTDRDRDRDTERDRESERATERERQTERDRERQRQRSAQKVGYIFFSCRLIAFIFS